jgi:hypothetical protein
MAHRRWGGIAASLLLGGIWILLGLAKLFDPDRAGALRLVLGSSAAGILATLISLLEVLVGGLLMWPRARATGLLLSIGLLTAYGAFAIFGPSVHCNCAGRLGALSDTLHLFLTAGMLFLAALGLLSVMPARQQAVQRRQALAMVTLCVLAIAGGWLLQPPASRRVVRVDGQVRIVDSGDASESPRPTLATSPREPMPRPREIPSGGAEPVAEIRGVVVLGSEPVPKARVWISSADSGFHTPLRSAESDASGVFNLAGAASDPDWVCAIGPSARPFAVPFRDVPRDERGLVVALDRAGLTRVSGSVVDEDGLGIPGAQVYALGRFGEDLQSVGGFGPRAIPDVAVTSTDDIGTFTLDLSAGPYRMVARASGYAPPTAAKPTLVEPVRQEEPIVLTLRKIYVLSVMAVDAVTRAPVPSAMYEVALRGGWQPAGLALPKRRPARGAIMFGSEAGRATQAFVLAKGMKPSATRVVIGAPGYEIVTASVEPKLAATKQTYEVPLPRTSPDGASIEVSFAASWPSGEAFEGQAMLIVRQGDQPREYPAWFVDGVVTMPLPPGQYHASLAPWEGSSIQWRQPVRVMWTPFEVAPSGSSRVVLQLRGGRLVVRPKTEAGLSVRDFTVSVDGTAFNTWDEVTEFTRDGDGVVIYLNQGAAAIRVRKFGFESVDGRQDIPDDGAKVVWEPILRTTDVQGSR